MNLAETLRGLWRRWYIVVPGLILAAALAVGAWFLVPPAYERSASQLLLPGAQSLPTDANPFLYLGGLSNAADVLVRAVGSANVLDEVEDEFPGAEVEITRDVSTSGPVILIKATGSSDEEATAILAQLVDRTGTVLADLQDDERIPESDRITVTPISIDQQSVIQQRDRFVAVAAVGIVVTLVVLVVASLVDGLMLQRRRRATPVLSDDDVYQGFATGDLATPGEDEPDDDTGPIARPSELQGLIVPVEEEYADEGVAPSKSRRSR